MSESSLPPPPPPPPPQTPSKGKRKRPRTGFIIILIGAIMIIFEALLYLAIGILGNISLAIGTLVSVLGIIFAAFSKFFGYRGRMETEKTKRNIYGLVPFFIGLIIIAASSQIYVTFVDTLLIAVGGLMFSLGGALISAGR